MKNKTFKIFLIFSFLYFVNIDFVHAVDVTWWTTIPISEKIPVSTPLELPPDLTTESETITVSAVDTLTGEITITPTDDCEGGNLGNFVSSWNPLTAHYWQGGNLKPAGWGTQNTFYNLTLADIQTNLNAVSTQGDFCVYWLASSGPPCIYTLQCYTDHVNKNYNDQFYNESGIDPAFMINDVIGGIGLVASGYIGIDPIELYTDQADVPQPVSCFDGIQNQDETGIDCGGICETNFGFTCPPPPSCFDGIMNQDETSVDFGGVCGTGTPVITPPNPATFQDANTDGIDDISGVTATGAIPMGSLPGGDGNTFDSTWPGDETDVGDTDIVSLIGGFVALNPLVTMAQGITIDTTNSSCSFSATIFNKLVTFDFCEHEALVDLIGVFVLLLFTIRSVFVALGV